MQKECLQSNERSIISCWVFKFARIVVFIKMAESKRLKLFQKEKRKTKRERRERCAAESIYKMERNEEVEGFGFRSCCR